MVRCLLLAYGLSVFQGPARADEPKSRIGRSPCLIRVHEVDKASASLVFRQAKANIRMEEIERQTLVDGKIVIRKTSVNAWVARTGNVALSLKEAKVYDTTGMRLAEAEILKRVKPGMAVVIARWGDKIGLDYLFVFKKETLIVVLPAHREVPRPEPLPASILSSDVETFADVCDELISRGFQILFAFL